jgi:transcriptional regulator with XRE-family HTH domain
MNRLKALRKERKLTQIQVAEAVGVEQTTYGKYELEQRAPSNEVLQKLADFFNVSTDYLLGRTDVPRSGEISALRIQGDVPYQELPPEAIQQLEEYKQFLIEKYGKKKEN